MHIERIQKAIETMHGVQARIDAHEKGVRFDMGEWGHRDECGTTACGAGWLCLDPWHRAQGLTYERSPDDGQIVPVFGIEIGQFALANYLEIGFQVCSRIFVHAKTSAGFPIVTAADVAQALRFLLETQ